MQSLVNFIKCSKLRSFHSFIFILSSLQGTQCGGHGYPPLPFSVSRSWGCMYNLQPLLLTQNTVKIHFGRSAPKGFLKITPLSQTPVCNLTF